MNNIVLVDGNIRGTLLGFVTKFDITYGIINVGDKFEEVEIDRLKILKNV